MGQEQPTGDEWLELLPYMYLPGNVLAEKLERIEARREADEEFRAMVDSCPYLESNTCRHPMRDDPSDCGMCLRVLCPKTVFPILQWLRKHPKQAC